MTEEQTTQAGEGSAQTDNQSLLAPEATVTEVKAEPEIPHRELTDEEKAAQAPEEDEKLERPDFWPENFWSDADGPDVEALAKSYNELRTKFSQGQHKAPKDGKYNLEAFKAANVPDDAIHSPIFSMAVMGSEILSYISDDGCVVVAIAFIVCLVGCGASALR